MQLLKPLFFCSFRKFVEYWFQFLVFSTNDKDCIGIPLYWIEGWGSHPIGGRNIDIAADQVRIDHPVVFFFWKLIFHRRITELRQG